MSSEEKQNIVSLFSILLVSVPYLLYVFIQFNNETFTTEEELKFWAGAFLLMIPIRIVAQILMYIIFTIGVVIVTGDEEEANTITDERDFIVDLKGERNAHYIFIFGFLAAMISILLDGGLSAMFVILIVSGFASELFGIFSKMFYYRVRV